MVLQHTYLRLTEAEYEELKRRLRVADLSISRLLTQVCRLVLRGAIKLQPSKDGIKLQPVEKQEVPKS
jgi:hypothetical protein